MSGRTDERRTEDRRTRIDRSRARAWALQILYRWEAGESRAEDSIRDAFVETMGSRRIAPRRLPYIRLAVKTIDANLPEIDRTIQGCLDNWRLDRLAAIDRALLRLATAEMLYMEDIPPKVSIHEAILLAEQYGGDESPRFVNGVLDALYKRLPELAG